MHPDFFEWVSVHFLNRMVGEASTHFSTKVTPTVVQARELAKPDKQSISNNRLFVQLPFFEKWYLKCLEVTFKYKCQELYATCLGGVSAGTSICHHIARVNAMLGQARTWGQPLLLLKIDIARMFATIDHQHLADSLRYWNVPEPWINIFMKQVVKVSLQVQTLKRDSVTIDVECGVMEGAPISTVAIALSVTRWIKELKAHPNFGSACASLEGDSVQESLQIYPCGWVDDWFSLWRGGKKQSSCSISSRRPSNLSARRSNGRRRGFCQHMKLNNRLS